MSRELFVCMLVVYTAGGWLMFRCAIPVNYQDETAEILIKLIGSLSFSGLLVLLNAKNILFAFICLAAVSVLLFVKGSGKKSRRIVFLNSAFLLLFTIFSYMIR